MRGGGRGFERCACGCGGEEIEWIDRCEDERSFLYVFVWLIAVVGRGEFHVR